MAKKDGGWAFPSEQHETQDGTWNQTFSGGMTLRDWFAGQALACISAPTAEDVAKAAYVLADAMLEERIKE